MANANQIKELQVSVVQTRSSQDGSPTWEIAHLFPNQGTWAEEEYLSLGGNHLIEFSDGVLEVLPMPTELHQLIVLFLYRRLFDFVTPKRLGIVVTAPLRVQIADGKFREPDVVLMLARHADRRGNRFWRGADLAIEVVSEDDPDRDLVTKRAEYAQAGIQEYWIVDPRDQTILVLTLDHAANAYAEAGRHAAGDTVRSVLLDGFSIPVSEVFADCDADA
jgi:Uma2 family endonuclease